LNGRIVALERKLPSLHPLKVRVRMSDIIASQTTRGPMLNQSGLARHFGVSVMAVWRWRRHLPDFPPAVEIAGRLYWSLEAIEAWKAERAAHARPVKPPAQGGARGDQARVQAARKANSATRHQELIEASTRSRQRKKKAPVDAQEAEPAGKRARRAEAPESDDLGS
jgi:predicted DNA-binding transcriptional regulator AlpA